MNWTEIQSSAVRLIAFFCAVSGLAIHGACQEIPAKTVASKSEAVEKSAVEKSASEKSAVDEKHPLFPLLQISYKSQKLLEAIEDYECVFVKQEMIGKKLLKSKMTLKYRETPQSVYLKFLEANAGREVIFVQGQNNNNLLVHEAGLKSVLGTFSLAPTCADAMSENRYPINTIGLRIMLASVIKQWEAEGKYGGITTKKYEKSTSPSKEMCTVYESIHSQPFKEFKFHTTRLWIDDNTGLAIGVQQYGFPGKNDKEPPLIEEYFYLKLRTNLKLTDNDFSKTNTNYAFK